MFDEPQPPPAPDPGKEARLSPAEEKFRSCRWYAAAESGNAAYCTHRDVLPFAGTGGFKAEAWCPDCEFFKIRRTPKKREPSTW